MSTLYPSPLLRPGGVSTRRWTAEEYWRLSELGFFNNQRVELIDGEIIQMSPIHNPHAAAVTRLSRLFFRALSEDRYWVRVQATLGVGDNFPEPDVAIVPGPVSEEGSYPTTAILVIEVSDSTLEFDQTTKMSLYASAGIPEYWVVNIPEKRVEVYLAPIADATMRFGHRYQDVRYLTGDSGLTPIFEPSVSFAVNQIIR